MGYTLAVFFTDDKYRISLSVDAQVTRHADGFQKGDLIFRNGIFARSFHLAQHREIKVHKLNRDHRVVYQILFH